MSTAVFVRLRRRFSTQITSQQSIGLWIIRLTNDGRHYMIIPTIRIVVSNYYSSVIPIRKILDTIYGIDNNVCSSNGLEYPACPSWKAGALRKLTEGRLPEVAASQKSEISY